MMKWLHRLLPAPLLSVALAVLWLLLNRSLEAGQIVLAVVAALVVPAFTAPLRPTPMRLRRPLLIARVFFRVGFDVLLSNLQVARGTLGVGRAAPIGGFIRVPLDLRHPGGLAVLAAIATVIPGSIWSELALDRSALLVHVFDLKDPDREIAAFKERYEKPLMEIFE